MGMPKAKAIRRSAGAIRFIDTPLGGSPVLARWACQPQANGSGFRVSGASVTPCLIVAAAIVARRLMRLRAGIADTL
jgi:hypothetical protein